MYSQSSQQTTQRIEEVPSSHNITQQMSQPQRPEGQGIPEEIILRRFNQTQSVFGTGPLQSQLPRASASDGRNKNNIRSSTIVGDGIGTMGQSSSPFSSLTPAGCFGNAFLRTSTPISSTNNGSFPATINHFFGNESVISSPQWKPIRIQQGYENGNFVGIPLTSQPSPPPNTVLDEREMLRKKIGEMQAKIECIKTKTEDREARKEILRKALEEKTAQLDQAQVNEEKLNEKLFELTEKLGETERECTRMQADLRMYSSLIGLTDEAKERFYQNQITELQMKGFDLDSKLKNAVRNVKVAKEEESKAQDRLTSMENRNRRRKEDIEDLNNQINEIKQNRANNGYLSSNNHHYHPENGSSFYNRKNHQGRGGGDDGSRPVPRVNL